MNEPCKYGALMSGNKKNCWVDIIIARRQTKEEEQKEELFDD
jgi:hypothetical protein